MSKIPIALTIAGSDSGGGAGIQADLKSFSANRVFGASVLTALTAQNTVGVTAIHDVPADFIAEQMDAVFSDLTVDAVKIGMLSQIPVIEIIAEQLEKRNAQNIVFDPVMVTTSGDPLLADDAVDAIRSILIPKVQLLTPNLFEAARLTDKPVASSNEEMLAQAHKLIEQGVQAVLIKGGHGESDECSDLLAMSSERQWFSAPRIDTNNTHGTGCSLSSAIAANLAHGKTLPNAIEASKQWLTGAIAASDELDVGSGPGPVHHFHNLWS